MKQKPTTPLMTAQKTGGFAALALAVFCADMLPAQAQQNAAVRSLPGGDRNLLVEAVAPVTAANSSQRVALVIGNAAYKEAPLVNPVNDARAMAQALRESGFTVILRENTDQRTLLQALREFGDRLRAGGTGLFYYAGHGMQIKGRNYLIPVGAPIEREDEVAYNAVDAQAVLDKMEAAGNAANIMILDACRNNPFTRSTRSGQAGLAQMDAPVGTLVAFSTSPGAVASDGSGANGLYTQHLLTAVRQNGSKIEDVFKQVRSNVRRDSQGKQVPWEVTSLEGDFYFRGAPATSDGGTGASAAAGAAVENALWDAVKTSDMPIEIRAYLGRYPNGLYAAAARERLTRLQPALAVAVVAATHARPATQQVAATAPVAARASTGDSWSYITENQLTGTRSNYSRKVSSISANGDNVINDGAQVANLAGHTRYIRNAERERFFSDGYKLVPSQLRAGFKETLNYNIRSKYKDGSEKTFSGNGTLEVLGREKINTPAGQFMAWRIHRLMRGADTRDADTSGSAGAEFAGDLTTWFVPEINSIVATENTETNVRTGKVSLKTRDALTAFNLVDAASASTARNNLAQAAAQPGGTAFMMAGTDGSVDQTAVNKRTEELLATIAAQKPAGAARPSAFSNSFGMTTGDIWRYQTVDKFKKEVVANWSRRIDSLNTDGSIKLNDGYATWTPDGTITLLQGKDGYRREYSPGYKWLPATLKAGYSEQLKHTMAYRNVGGPNGSEDREGTLTVVGKETVKVPAGEFEAWKIEAAGFGNGKNTSNNSAYAIRFKETFWYVPALRNFVASDFEQFSQSGQVQFNSRQELTSFNVRGAENLAQR